MTRTPTLLECRHISRKIELGCKIADNDGELYIVKQIGFDKVKAVKFGFGNPLYTFKKSSIFVVEE